MARRSDNDGPSWLVERGAHEHYEDAELYDHEYRRRRADVSWYVALARRVLGGPGTVLELGAAVGELLDVRVNDRLIARGEAVAVGDVYGVRVVEVVGDDVEPNGSEGTPS